MENLVFEGFKFMLLGMGTVFSFLILMIGAMNLLSYFIHKFFPEPIPTIDSSSSKTNTMNKTNKNAKIAAATAAIMYHQNVKS
jgi:oxaloacetate decarboxylase gamma subunit